MDSESVCYTEVTSDLAEASDMQLNYNRGIACLMQHRRNRNNIGPGSKMTSKAFKYLKTDAGHDISRFSLVNGTTNVQFSTIIMMKITEGTRRSTFWMYTKQHLAILVNLLHKSIHLQ